MLEETYDVELPSADATSVGTRFLIYPQSPLVADYETPELIWISTPPDRIQAGPSDHRAYVLDPLFDKQPYEYPYMPPFSGDSYPPATASFSGHFDTFPANSRQFIAAHAFACVGRVLDIWESYLGHPITWHFAETYERLEIIPFVNWDNAQSGYGYLELGVEPGANVRSVPYALNFDVIAHEVGHAIVFSQSGFPAGTVSGSDFAPIHEASADLVSLLSFLHFDSGIDRLLRHCNGNLLVLNELNRIAELSGNRQIRLACNSRHMSDVTNDVHDRSRPLTGAMFDTLVSRYHAILVQEGLAEQNLLNTDIRDIDEKRLRRVSELTTGQFRTRPFQFKSALTQARDDIAKLMAQTWSALPATDFEFRLFAQTLVETSERSAPQLSAFLEENLTWRELL